MVKAQIQRLKKSDALRDQKLISEEEYKTKRQLLLDELLKINK